MCMCMCHAHPCSCHAHTMDTHHHHAVQEQLEALSEAYADPEAEKMSSDDEGGDELD